jgi:hypothetical protein
MKIKTPKDHDFEKIYKAYAGLIEWIGGNDVDGQETLGLLLKASVSIAVTNRLAKEEVLEVVGVTYDIESMMRPKAQEVH